MRPSSAICRAQEIAERDRAASATLENVRVVAIRAAEAWQREARWAERREHRHKETKEAAARSKNAKLILSLRNDDLLSEHSDRGRADG